jgi:hypothetical protein
LMNAETEKTAFWKQEGEQGHVDTSDDKTQVEPQVREDKIIVSRNGILEEKQKKHVETLFMLTREIMKEQGNKTDSKVGRIMKEQRDFVLMKEADEEEKEESREHLFDFPHDKSQLSWTQLVRISVHNADEDDTDSSQKNGQAGRPEKVLGTKTDRAGTRIVDFKGRHVAFMANPSDRSKNRRDDIRMEAGTDHSQHGKLLSRNHHLANSVHNDADDLLSGLKNHRRERDQVKISIDHSRAKMESKDRGKRLAGIARQLVRSRDRYEDPECLLLHDDDARQCVLPNSPFSAAMYEALLILVMNMDKFLGRFDETETACCRKPETDENDPNGRANDSDASSCSSSCSSWRQISNPQQGQVTSYFFHEVEDMSQSASDHEEGDNTIVNEFFVESTPDDFNAKRRVMSALSVSTCSSSEADSSSLSSQTDPDNHSKETKSTDVHQKYAGQDSSKSIGDRVASLIDKTCDTSSIGKDGLHHSTRNIAACGEMLAADENVPSDDAKINVGPVDFSSLNDGPNHIAVQDCKRDDNIGLPGSDKNGKDRSKDAAATAAGQGGSKASSSGSMIAPSLVDKGNESTDSHRNVAVRGRNLACLDQDQTRPQRTQPQAGVKKQKARQRKTMIQMRQLLGFGRRTKKSSF